MQLAKDQVMFDVVRTSPEEKIADFHTQMTGLISVMNRQKLLANSLTPIVHTFFGGKSALPPAALAVIPSQRLTLLVITLFLNGYYSYNNYTSDGNMSGSPTSRNFFASQVWHDLVTETDIPFIIYLIRVLHFAISVSLVIRKVLNSRALDSESADTDINTDDSNFYRLLKFLGRNLVLSPVTLFQVMLSSWWTIALCGLSFLGLRRGVGFYAGCILDAIPQIRYMSFLVTAVKNNVVKISLTMLLAGILLYQYAVITFFYFPDEVS